MMHGQQNIKFTPLVHSHSANRPTDLSTTECTERNMFCDKQAGGRAFDGGSEPKQTFGQNTGALKPQTAQYRETTKWVTIVTATVAASQMSK
jgi:hypothetical protein